MSAYETISLIVSGLGLIVSLLGLFSLIIAIKQIKLSVKQAKEHHEEQRRIKTIEILHNWNNGLKKESRLAEKIVEKLDKDQCLKLYEYTPFTVSEDTHKMICQMCSRYQPSCTSCKANGRNEYLVDGLQLIELRGNVTNYLNNLEIVALAWQQAIVDCDAVEKQFTFLHNPGKKSALHTYRTIAGGGNSYPVTDAFYKQIMENQRIKSPQKKAQ